MGFELERAGSDVDALQRIETRLRDDVGFLIDASKRENRAPFWAITRSLFPVAESLASLLTPHESSAKQLSQFIETILGDINPKYKTVCHVVCQIWRHRLTHSDVPPLLASDGKKVGWCTELRASPTHLDVSIHTATEASVTFCLESFYQDLLAVCADPASLARRPTGDIMKQYNEWLTKSLSKGAGPKAERKAACQIHRLLP